MWAIFGYPTRLTVVLVLMLAAAVMYVDRRPEFVFGRIEQMVPLNGGHKFVRVKPPFRDATAFVLPNEAVRSQPPGPGDWLLVHGAVTIAEARPLLVASRAMTLPIWLPTLPSADSLLRQLAAVPMVTVLLGCVVLVVGPLLDRMTAKSLAAVVGALTVGHGLRVAGAAGWFVLPEMANLAISILGALLALILSRRFAADPGSLMRRAVAALGIWLLLPPIAAVLALPAGATPALVLAPLFVPSLAHATIAASLLTIGLAAQNELAKFALMLFCIVAAIGLHGQFLRVRAAQVQDGRFRGLVPLSRVLAR